MQNLVVYDAKRQKKIVWNAFYLSSSRIPLQTHEINQKYLQ